MAPPLLAISLDEFRIVPLLNVTACVQDEDQIRNDEEAQYDPEDDPPLIERLLGRQHADDVRCENARERADTVHQRH